MKTETYLNAYLRVASMLRGASMTHSVGREAQAHKQALVKKWLRQRDRFLDAAFDSVGKLRTERNSALAALAAAQAMTQELAQMRTLIVEVRDKVARLERQLMTADERRLAEVHRAKA